MRESEIRPKDIFNRYLALSQEDIEFFFSDKTGFVDVECPACGADSRIPGLNKLGFEYALCADCGTLYMTPRPTEDQLNTYYRDAKSVKFWSTSFYKETVEARRAKIFQPRAQMLAELVQTDRFANHGGVVVDIGSGYGIFLEEVEKLGIFQKIMGIEPNPDMAEICRQRGFEITQKPVEAVKVGEINAGIATAFEVLEHVFAPVEFLRATRSVLGDHGHLLFTTLTVSGFDIQVLWEHSKSVYPPHHINLISVEGMQRLVERAGLVLENLSTPGKLDVDIVRNMLAEKPDIEVPRFVSYLVTQCSEETGQAFQRFLADNRLSSHIRVIARG